MPTFVDRSGQRFGRLQVLSRAPNGDNGRVQWLCRCDCGSTKAVMGQSLIAGTTVSCGCFGDERRAAKGKNTTHGRSKTRAYRIWCGIRKRCLNPNAGAYPRYGGAGISICERWNDFAQFLSDMGEPLPHQSIERLDNKRGYEPGNCVWANATVQARNRKNARTTVIDGEVVPLVVAAERCGVSYGAMYARTRSSKP